MAPKNKLDPIQCPLCDFNTKHLTTFEKHVTTVHNKTLQELYYEINGSDSNKCHCGCGQITKWNNYKKGFSRFIIGHNASIYTSYDEETAQQLALTRGSNWRGKESPWLGKTKENDERVAKRAQSTSISRKKAFDEGRIQIWSTGKTKEDDERLAALSEKKKQQYASGELVQWHKGLNEDCDERVKRKNDDLRDRFESGELHVWHDGLTIADDPRIAKFHENRDHFETYKTIRLSDAEITKRLSNNMTIQLDHIENHRIGNVPSCWMRCTRCNWYDKVTFVFAKSDHCPKCNPVGSKLQHNVSNWIEHNGVTVSRNVRGILHARQELDIFIPQYKLAIEVNGLYFHNEAAGKDMSYHQRKSEMCSNVGLSLIHIFEDEWYNQQDKIKSLLLHRLHLTPSKIYARKCSTVSLSKECGQQFFEDNHINSNDSQATEYYGLQYNDEIVYAISIKFIKDKIHICRITSKLNTHVCGGFNKLISFLTKKFSDKHQMTHELDTRFYIGHPFEQYGFKLIEELPPQFWWTDGHKRQNVKSINASKIWACKNKLYVLDL